MAGLSEFDATLVPAAWFDPHVVPSAWFEYGLPFSHTTLETGSTPPATNDYATTWRMRASVSTGTTWNLGP